MELSESLLGMVRAEARRIHRLLPRETYALDDLIGHGHVGLLEARDRFDAQRGIPFDVFARRRIRGAMFDALRRQGWLGRRGWEDVRRQALAHDVVEGSDQVEAPGVDDAAALHGVVAQLAMAFLTDATLDALGAAADPDAALEAAQLQAELRRAMDALPDDDREVVDAVYDFHDAGDTGARLAERRRISRSTVSRAHVRILDGLRGALTGFAT
jgi:RNA polymerase sigma factor for flagellar operon FliA